MLPHLLLLAGSVSCLPSPQLLTAEEFSARGRSLDLPQDVFITSSYTHVRRQGRMGTQDIIKFPTLEVRDPNELSRGRAQNTLFSAGPVYKKSTEEIEAKIRDINAALTTKLEAAEKKLEDEVKALGLVDDIDELTDLAAAEMVAEEIAQNIGDFVDLKVKDVIVKEEAEAMAKEIVSEMEEMEAALVADVVTGVEENSIEEEAVEKHESELAAVTEEDKDSLEEGSGRLPTLDFGDITEVAV